jgi:hypothetical protein
LTGSGYGRPKKHVDPVDPDSDPQHWKKGRPQSLKKGKPEKKSNVSCSKELDVFS